MATQGSKVITRGSYKHQGDWITSIATTGNVLVSGSRDKTLLVWNINGAEQENFMRPKTLLTGHNHIIQDVALSSDGLYALTASWDNTLRLWDLEGKKSIARLVGHTKDVLSVSLSKGNRQIISAGRDKVIKLWNIHGECKYTTEELPEWITCVRFGMTDDKSPVVSAGYDRLVRVWDRETFKQKYALTGHTGFINTIALSPDSTLIASGGHDQHVNLSDIPSGTFLYSLNAGDVVNCLAFAQNRFWLAVGTDSSLKIFCLNRKVCIIDLKLQAADLEIPTGDAKKEEKEVKPPKCLSCAFSDDGMNLFAGYSDGYIRAWNLPSAKE